MDANSVVFAKALADDTRQDMLKHLCCVWLSVNDLVDKLGGKVKQPTVSHHLTQLRNAGLVESERRGMNVFHTAHRDALVALCVVLDPNCCS